MILSSGARPGAAASQQPGPTLDALLRRRAEREPGATALADPPDRPEIDGQPPRRLTYAEADGAVSGLAGALRGLRLQGDDVVAIALPNVTDCILAILAVLRAGMIAAPLPLLFGRRSAAEALGRVGAKALISCARLGAEDQAARAFALAADVFTIRHVCAIAADDALPLPDGMVALGAAPVPAALLPQHAADTGSPPAIITWDIGPHGLVPVARSHGELIAGGRAVLAECPEPQGSTLLTTLPATSFAGLAAGLVPWLLGGGTLALHHGFSPDAFAVQQNAEGAARLVLPGPAVRLLAEAGLLGAGGDPATVVAVWRAPERLALEEPVAGGPPAVVDIQVFGEIGLVAARRGADGRPAPTRFGLLTAPRRGGDGAVPAVELMPSLDRTLMLRGPMVPAAPFRTAAPAEPQAGLAIRPNGFVDTGYPCSRDDAGAMVLTGPPGGLSAIGGYRCRLGDVAARVAAACPGTSVLALPDALLGQRLAVEAVSRAAARQALAAAGEDPIVLAALG